MANSTEIDALLALHGLYRIIDQDRSQDGFDYYNLYRVSDGKSVGATAYHFMSHIDIYVREFAKGIV